MNPSNHRQKIGEACVYWEDESPTRRRNRLAQREYRKRKRHAARSVSKELDCRTKSPSPTRLQSCDTEIDLPSIVQPTVPVGSLGFYLSEAGQVTPDGILNAGNIQDNIVKAGSAHPCEGPPGCFSIAKKLEFRHAPDLSGRYLGTEQLDFETREYLWPNGQVPALSNPEINVGLQTSIGSLVVAVNPSIACTPHLPPCVTADIVGSMDNMMGGLYDCGMLSDPFRHASPGNPKDHFGRFINTCETEECPSIDSVATQYCPASLPTTTRWAPTQSCSRSRDPLQLPDNSYMAPLPWGHERRDLPPPDESKRFREQVLRLAGKFLNIEIGQLGMAYGDQTASIVPALADQSKGETGFDGSSKASRRGFKGSESFKERKPLPFHWLTNGYEEEADA